MIRNIHRSMHKLSYGLNRAICKEFKIHSLKKPFHSMRSALAHTPFNLADIGEGIAEVEILEWHVKVGDHVDQFDPICDVQSDKANVSITSRYDGKIVSIKYEIGDMAKVGTPLIVIDTDQDTDDEEEKDNESTSESTVLTPTIGGSTITTTAATSITNSTTTTNFTSTDGKKVLTSPAVRRLSKENNLDLTNIIATGKGGRLLKEDVLKYMDTATKVDTSSSSSSSTSSNTTRIIETEVTNESPNTITEDKTIPIRGLTRLMVNSMSKALDIPHFGYSDEYCFDALSDARLMMAPLAKERGTKITYMPLIIKAASMALLKYPRINSRISEDKESIIEHAAHNIGVAMDTPRGLLVPVIKNVQDKSVIEIAAELVSLQELGSNNKLGEKHLSGATFTLSNIGVIGGTYTSPVITPPQVAIGALGKVQTIPMFDSSGNVVPMKVANFSFAADHRILDGVTMAKFSNQMKSYLEHPLTMLCDTK